MRAIIIEDKDALALLDRLKLQALEEEGHFRGKLPSETRLEEMHRIFHYVVVRWLQEQGASCVR